jgi:phospholipid/cholesterol/gamma-HCH transport system permease protein
MTAPAGPAVTERAAVDPPARRGLRLPAFLEDSMTEVGRFFLILGRTLAWTPRRPWDWRELSRQMVKVGVQSIPVITLTTLFTGAVMALQTFTTLRRFHAESYVGSLVALSMVRELSAVLGGLIVAGRAGSAMGAELGTMRVTEQIDALESLGRSPASHLLIPRILAGLVMIPVLTVFANIMACLAGWYLVKQVLPITDADFVYGMQYYWRDFDGWYSIIKAFFFAGSITLIPCYVGFNTQQGAEGVGRSTTAAVVNASVLILLLDVLLAKLLLNN